VAAEYQEHFGEHAYDDEGNYIGAATDAAPEEAWPEYLGEDGEREAGGAAAAEGGEDAAGEVPEATPADEADTADGADGSPA
jgi:hypothetical protein